MQSAQRLVSGVDGLDLEAFGAQPNTEQAQQSGIVIDEQDLAFGTRLDSLLLFANRALDRGDGLKLLLGFFKILA